MTPAAFAAKSGIDHLRLMVRNFDACNESFNTTFTPQQLFKIHRAWMLSDWDIYPDNWTERQVAEALRGLVPQWDECEKPVYPGKAVKVT